MSKTNKIVVVGGSFNPPTIAHKRIMEEAIQAIGADKGIFIPSSENYVSRKMSKKTEDNQVYTEEHRHKMLELLIENSNYNIEIDDCEYGDDGRGHTYNTLKHIAEKYNDSEVYSIVGTDNLAWMCRWKHKEKLFSKFNFIVITRDGDNAQQIIENDETLSLYRDHFVIIKQPEGIENISSTLARKLINEKDKALNNILDSKVINLVYSI